MTLPAADPLLDEVHDADAARIDMFELAPVALSLEDYSALRRLFDRWRDDGVTDLRAWLTADESRVVSALALIRLIRVNRRTLELFGAETTEHMVANMHLILRGDMHERYIDELVLLWDGRDRFTSQTVNYTIQGARLDVVLSTQVLPGHEATWRFVLLSIEDMTERLAVQRALGHSEAYARTLFEHSPVSLWVEDYGAVKRLLDAARASGVTDLRRHLEADPGFAPRCARAIRVLDVNRRTLDMFGAADLESLLDHLPLILGDGAQPHFVQHLLQLWEGELFQQREVIHRSMSATPIDVYKQFAVLPSHAHDWSLVLVSLIDITARKQAEAEADYLGTHDSLTGLRNRSFFAAELSRLEREGPWPVGIVVFDLNGLKPVNDQQGHAAGDLLIRRAGDVLGASLSPSFAPSAATSSASPPGSSSAERGHAARVGGDEFVLLLPGTHAASVADLLRRLLAQVAIDNTLHDGAPLSFSVGTAMLAPGDPADAALHLADQRMYADKRAHYASRGVDRRGAGG